MTMQIARKPIANILKVECLEVPAFHRSYVWTESNVRQLLDDMRENKFSECFIGTVVTSAQDGESSRLQVIDGQQRLATVSLLLAAARDRFAQIGAGDFAEEMSPYLSSKNVAAKDRNPKLNLSGQDDEFFRGRFIAGNSSIAPERESHKRLAGGYARIRAEIDHMSNRALSEWVEFVKTRLKVIHVEADPKADACVLFEALNDRESGMTQSELTTLAYGRRPPAPAESVRVSV